MRNLTKNETYEVNGGCHLNLHDNPLLTPEELAELCEELSRQPSASYGTGSGAGAGIEGTTGNRSSATRIR